MLKGKRSFFERLTGGVPAGDYDEFEDEEVQPVAHAPQPRYTPQYAREEEQEINEWGDEGEVEGQLTVDVYQTPDEIIIRSIVAGVRPEDLDISITRDMVTIQGRREEHKEVSEENYFHKELYWGSFSRTILLPAEVETEEAQATEKHGLLTIRLPKIDKERQTKLKVKTG